jgi:hypothetical protein
VLHRKKVHFSDQNLVIYRRRELAAAGGGGSRAAEFEGGLVIGG